MGSIESRKRYIGVIYMEITIMCLLSGLSFRLENRGVHASELLFTCLVGGSSEEEGLCDELPGL